MRSNGLLGAWSQISDPLAKEAFRVKNSADILPDDEARIINANQTGLFDARGDLIEQDYAKWRSGTNPTPGAPTKLVNPVSGKDYSPVAGATRTGDAASHARRGSFNKGIDSLDTFGVVCLLWFLIAIPFNLRDVEYR